MAFLIQVIELTDAEVSAKELHSRGIKRYEQTVDTIDMGRIMAAVNFKPRKKRAANKEEK